MLLYFRNYHIACQIAKNSAEFRGIPCRIIGQNFAEFCDYFHLQNFVYLPRDTLQGSRCTYTSRCSKSLCGVDTSRCSSGPCGVDTSRCSSGPYGVDMSKPAQAPVVQTSSGVYQAPVASQGQHRLLLSRQVLVQLVPLWCRLVQVPQRPLKS
jgi:hypothetical protein